MKHAVVTDLVRSVATSTASGDHIALVRACSGWPTERLTPLLKSQSVDVVSAAVIALGVNGTMSHCRELVPLLARPNPKFVEIVEDSLWSIWMRAGSPNANHLLADAVRCMQDDKPVEADVILRELVQAEPEFAEPHHQRGIALATTDDVIMAAEEFSAALRWNPYHYSAAANLGHMRVHRDDFSGALDAYARALQIHPNLLDLPETMAGLRQILQQAS